MLFFKQKNPQEGNFSALGVDMHSHLIPAVDDGANSKEDSLSLIKGLADLGFEKLFTTPHSMLGTHPNTKATLTDACDIVSPLVPHGIELLLSSEYYLDEHFDHLLATDQLLPLPGNRLLVEFSQVSRPMQLEETLFDLALKGYQIVLAHPERYLFFHKNFNDFIRLKDMGLEFQVNALSLSNHYGKNIRAVAEKLIEHQLIDFMGTDTHNLKHIELLKAIPSSKYYKKLIGSGILKNRELLE